MKRFLGIAVMALAFATPMTAAQVPADKLMTPPADAERFTVVSSAGKHGWAAIWRAPDGSVATRTSILLRGYVYEQDQKTWLSRTGVPDRVEIRGVDPSGDAAELFAVEKDVAHWRTPADDGSATYDGHSFYVSRGGPFLGTALLAEQLFRAPGHTLHLLPSGEARLIRLAKAEVGDGAAQRTVVAYAIEGLTLSPVPVWLDSDGGFFASISFLSLMPEAYVGARAQLAQIQAEALARRAPAMADRFGRLPAGPVAFTHVRLFDSEAGKFAEDQTVVVSGERIAAAGDASRIRVPAGAQTIDGRGKTLVPGLWDAHMHVADDDQGLQLLSLGITSVRDPGNDVEATIARAARIREHRLLFPAIYPSLLIDGAGPMQAQLGITVHSAAETIEAVRTAQQRGFVGVKFYTSMRPEWLRAGTAEARRLGLHVHGHIPATMRPSDAIAAGYDEITHINFVIMEAMPYEVVDETAGILRVQGPLRFARNVDLRAEPMASLIVEMGRRKIAADPTLAVSERDCAGPRDLSPALAPFVGTVPPATERDFRGGGLMPEDLTQAECRASYSRLAELTAALYRAGAPVVAGTDGSGLEIVRELELYVDAGLSPAEALRTATILPAELVGVGRQTGSIKVGKQADLVLVDGDPSRRIGDLRQTLWIMSNGRLMNADELREAAGFRGRPR